VYAVAPFAFVTFAKEVSMHRLSMRPPGPRRFARAPSWLGSWSGPARVASLLLTLTASTPSSAATLHPGDVVVLGMWAGFPTFPSQIFVVTPANGALQQLDFVPSLPAVRDIVVLRNGTLLVTQQDQGILRVNPANGAWSVVQGIAAFGGSAPTALALAANGDVLAAGTFGVARLAGGFGAPSIISSSSFPAEASSIATDGGANIWVSYGFGSINSGIVRVDPTTGTATGLSLSSAIPYFPDGIASMHLRPDGFLYVVNKPGSAELSANASGGIVRVDPATGASTLWLSKKRLAAMVWDDADLLWMSVADESQRAPTLGHIEGGSVFLGIGNRGPMALVPTGATAARTATWGAVKRLFR
jgi:hypothetical protein